LTLVLEMITQSLTGNF